jgi:protein gp37
LSGIGLSSLLKDRSMSANSKIEWTDATWNPVRGCARVSDGCKNCYAERVAARFSGAGQPYEGLVRKTSQGPKWTGDVKLATAALRTPLSWAKPRRVFVNSMSDLFHESVSFDFIASVFAVMSVTTRHTYQILTKRPARMLEFFQWIEEGKGVFDDDAISSRLPKDIPWVPHHHNTRRGGYDNCGPGYPYENVWIGVSVEDQRTAEERIPLLLRTPAAVRWISAEPLLGPIDLTILELPSEYNITPTVPGRINALTTHDDDRYFQSPSALDWVVVGGESGHGARPMHPRWARSLREQCAVASVPFFFKQWGEWAPGSNWPDDVAIPSGEKCSFDDPALDDNGSVWRVGKKAAGRELDGRTHDDYPRST